MCKKRKNPTGKKLAPQRCIPNNKYKPLEMQPPFTKIHSFMIFIKRSKAGGWGVPKFWIILQMVEDGFGVEKAAFF